jgi:hypothetical protein
MTPKARVAAADLAIYGEVVAVRNLDDQASPPTGVHVDLTPIEGQDPHPARV